MNRNDEKPADPLSSARDGIRAEGPLLQTVLDSLTHPFYVINVDDYQVRLANRAALEMHRAGTTTCYALAHDLEGPCDKAEHPCPMRTIMDTKEPVVVEHVHYDRQGRRRIVEVHAFPVLNEQGRVTQVIEYCVDITERRRMMERHQWELDVNKALAELADALIDPAFSIEEVANVVLARARQLTGSAHGYVSSIDPETGAIVGHTLTHMMGEQCRLHAKDQHIAFYPRPDGSFAALFGHALNTGRGFYTDAPSRHPASTGLPEGHIPLSNFLTVPAIVADEVVGQIALANSDRGYSDRDLEAMERMAKLYALAVQRRRAEMAMKNSEERYALAQKAAKIGSWDWNIVTGKLVWSERIEPMFGFAPGRFAGTYEAFLESVHPDDRQFVVDSVNACVERGENYQIEHRIVWPDGTVRWVSETGDVIRDDTGKAVRMLGIVQDISERKHAEQQLRDLAKFPSENPLPVLRVRGDATIAYTNSPGQKFLKTWNVRPGERLPQDWCRIISETLGTGVAQTVEAERADQVFSMTFAPVVDADYVNIYGRDITDQKKADRQIRKLNEQLEQRVLERTKELTEANKQLREEMQQRKRLEREILEISEQEQRRIGQELHDSLGQQLTGIAIMSKVLQQKLQKRLPDEAARVGEIVQLISQAIDETRQLSRGLHPVALDENGLMSALQALATTTQELFGISCDFRCDEPVLVEDASTAVHLYRIAQEAVTNAMRHAKAQRILIELRADERRAILSIDNDGRRFPKRLPRDKGMGLQIMSYRAEVIGGILEVHGGPTGGTRVTCTFDAKP